jgi:hypothetical protein
MADLFRLKQTGTFIAEWREESRWYGDGPCSAQAVAREQRSNLDSIKLVLRSSGRAPTWCDIEEYEQCVDLLEAEALRVARPYSDLGSGHDEAHDDRGRLDLVEKLYGL